MVNLKPLDIPVLKKPHLYTSFSNQAMTATMR